MIDKSKQYRTRDGREVRIYATDGAYPNAVHGAVHHIALGWMPHTWTKDGKTNLHENCDLIEVKPRHKLPVWLNIYSFESFTSHISREQAEDEQDTNRIACIKVDLDFEEGEGL